MSDVLSSPNAAARRAGDPEAASDAALAHTAGSVLAAPRAEPADSFVLHAPLELLARFGLLRHVDAGHRPSARAEILRLAERYERTGPPIDSPTAVPAAEPVAAAARLAASIAAGDLDDVDRWASALATTVPVQELGHLLTDAVLPRLSAAGHTPIGLHLFPLVAPAGEIPATILRGTLRELARYPGARLTWAPALGPAAGPDRSHLLAAAVAATPRIEPPASDFVWPTMAAAEASGVVADSLTEALAGPVDLVTASRQLLRVAAHSMLQDREDVAPYGWSHALTMPQGALGVAPHATDPRVAVAVAATYLVGFRATLGRRQLDLEYVPEPVDAALTDALSGGPGQAAAAAWHHDPSDRPAVISTLASWAAVREDAHLVKYVLGCIHAAAADPPAARLHLAAAAHLLAWWVRAERSA